MKSKQQQTTVTRGRIIKHGFRDYGFILIARNGDDVETARFEHVHYSEAGAMMLRSKELKARRAALQG